MHGDDMGIEAGTGGKVWFWGRCFAAATHKRLPKDAPGGKVCVNVYRVVPGWRHTEIGTNTGIRVLLLFMATKIQSNAEADTDT
jgi:hypothetical protein